MTTQDNSIDDTGPSSPSDIIGVYNSNHFEYNLEQGRSATTTQVDGGCWERLELARPITPRAAHSCDLVAEGFVVVFGGWNGQDALSDAWLLDLERVEWLQIIAPNAPSKRNNHATAVVDNRLFIHGGHDGSRWLGDLFYLDCSKIDVMTNGEDGDNLSRHTSCGGAGVYSQSGEPLLSLDSDDRKQHHTTKVVRSCLWMEPSVNGKPPQCRACHTLSRVRRKLYVFGGYDGMTCFNDIEILNLDIMQWSTPTVGGNIPKGRNAHSITVVGNYLYLCGGLAGRNHLTDFHVFDTTTLMWSEIVASGALPPALRGQTTTLVGDQIFLFGGFDGKTRNSDLFVFDVISNRWSHFAENANSPDSRQRHAATLVGSKRILFLGGFNGIQWLNDIHILNVGKLKDKWLNNATLVTLSNEMKTMVNNPHFSDVEFTLGEDKQNVFYAHKIILVTRCPYFNTMFTGHMKESGASQVNLPGWNPLSFKAALGYMYTGILETKGSVEVACGVLRVADHLGMDLLTHVCETELTQSLSMTNVCHVLKRAEETQAVNLKQKCLHFIFEHADEVLNTPAFDELASIPSLLMELAKLSLSQSGKGAAAASDYH